MNRRDLILSAFLALLVPTVLSLPLMETEQERRTRLIREVLSTPEGRAKLAASMVQSLRTAWLPLCAACENPDPNWDTSIVQRDGAGVHLYSKREGGWKTVPNFRKKHEEALGQSFEGGNMGGAENPKGMTPLRIARGES